MVGRKPKKGARMITEDEKLEALVRLDELKRILAEHGITMSIAGCGCCGSPEVKVEYQGKVVVDDVDVTFDMFTKA
jgi:hypothetical protein